MFNQTIATTTTTCLTESTTGAFCSEAITTSETTLNYLHLGFLLLIPLVIYWTAKIFIKK